MRERLTRRAGGIVIATTFFLMAAASVGYGATGAMMSGSADTGASEAQAKNPFTERGLVHIMGPSPAIVPGSEGAWDDWILESSDIFKDGHSYYWYYHARGGGKARPRKGYQVGVAIAPGPLGPWTRCEGNPILECGPTGSWDSEWVACACVMKESDGRERPGGAPYYMFYSGGGPGGSHVGLARASSPVGPWKKFEGNPVARECGYLASVIKVRGKYIMYSECPVGSSSPDQGPISVAIADQPTGPWRRYDRNPVLTPGDWGAWDDGGYSEGSVRYNDGIFHMFYGGTKARKLESIGYATSFDGYNWTKYPGNPVVPLTRVPDASGFAEVKALIEPPFIYLYHTLRYVSRFKDSDGAWATEHLGIQVLSSSLKFRIPFPILREASLRPRNRTRLKDCDPISLESAMGCAITVECTFGTPAKTGLRLHVISSHDGITYDTEDLQSFELRAQPGKTVRKTVEIVSGTRFMKVICDNLDRSVEIANLQVTATVAN